MLINPHGGDVRRSTEGQWECFSRHLELLTIKTLNLGTSTFPVALVKAQPKRQRILLENLFRHENQIVVLHTYENQ